MSKKYAGVSDAPANYILYYYIETMGLIVVLYDLASHLDICF